MEQRKKRTRYLEIQTTSPIWARQKGLNTHLNKVTGLVLFRLSALKGEHLLSAKVNLLLTTDQNVRSLNNQFRGLDKTTNVLSFPQFSKQELRRARPAEDGVFVAGDIAFSSQYVALEAKKQGKTLKNHATHLLIHGILHLFGYDHHNNRAAAEMEKLEIDLMAELGLPNPYADQEK